MTYIDYYMQHPDMPLGQVIMNWVAEYRPAVDQSKLPDIWECDAINSDTLQWQPYLH